MAKFITPDEQSAFAMSRPQSLRSLHFSMADGATAIELAIAMAVAHYVFDTSLSAWFALGWLVASSIMNRITFGVRMKRGV
jgi:hypothetical protein